MRGTVGLPGTAIAACGVTGPRPCSTLGGATAWGGAGANGACGAQDQPIQSWLTATPPEALGFKRFDIIPRVLEGAE